jgi:hypothetical protein
LGWGVGYCVYPWLGSEATGHVYKGGTIIVATAVGIHFLVWWSASVCPLVHI